MPELEAPADVEDSASLGSKPLLEGGGDKEADAGVEGDATGGAGFDGLAAAGATAPATGPAVIVFDRPYFSS